MAKRTRRFWLLAFPGSDSLDLSGPWEVLGHANDVLGREAYAVELVTPFGGDVRTRHGLTFARATSLSVAARHGLPDAIVVAGGSPVTPLPAPEAHLVAWLAQHWRRIPTLVSICTGAFVLGEAGILDGRNATTHWRFLGDLRSRFPRARAVDEGIFVRDGRVWTSAGISAGIDLMLALLEMAHGRRVVMEVARRLVLFLRRSGRQAQWSATLRRQEAEPGRLRDVTSFVLEHIDEPLPVERLARTVGMSVRSLSRWCRTELGQSPADLVRRHRIDEARRLLEDTTLPLKDVAQRVGLGDATTLWRAFIAALGVAPAAYRERFSEFG